MINKIALFLGVFSCSVFMVSCDSGTPKSTENSIEIKLTGDVHEHVYLEDFLRLMKDKNNILLDVRTLGEFNYGHIAGAKSFPVNSPSFIPRIRQLNKEATYLIYGDAGPRATSAVDQMEVAGVKRTFLLRRGIKAWADAGKSVVKK